MTKPTMTLETFGATYLRLRQLLDDVGDSQWRAGQSPVPKEDTTERSKGLTSDPTPIRATTKPATASDAPRSRAVKASTGRTAPSAMP